VSRKRYSENQEFGTGFSDDGFFPCSAFFSGGSFVPGCGPPVVARFSCNRSDDGRTATAVDEAVRHLRG
jgi:hypothetical protein